MYVAEERDVLRFDPNVGSGSAPVTIISRIPAGGHSTRTILFGPDGKLYLAVGSSCNLCDERDSLRAAVSQFNRDGSGGRIFAKGLRNTVGMAFSRTTRAVGRQQRPRQPRRRRRRACEHHQGRPRYGWPLLSAGHAQSRMAPPTAINRARQSVQAHSAPLGWRSTGTQFPRDVGRCVRRRSTSWVLVPTGAKVVRVKVDSATPGVASMACHRLAAAVTLLGSTRLRGASDGSLRWYVTGGKI
jgi:glucose/arabinose dehydrogenase